jgi:hypothetical protein
MNNIDYIESKGFTIRGRYIYKLSKSINRSKVVGQLNENNFFFYSENVYPFKGGTNNFNDSNITDNKYFNYVKELKAKESNDFNVDFEKYIEVTKEKSVFFDWLNKENKIQINKTAENYFDLRGVYDGYMENAVCFPFIDYNNNFITAQIIKYDSKGKRLKTEFSTNWFHSYKNIKNSLELKDKYSVSINCFFGENYLKDSDNIIAIVEAPKTACILKEIYPNIDWIATAGETQIKSKNLDVLKNRKVVLFPDAKTTLWSEFANENSFFCSTILEDESVTPGEDIADHIFNTNSEVYSKLHDQLTALNDGIIEGNNSFDPIELNFSVIRESQAYFTIINTNYKNKKVLVSIDNISEFKKVFSDKLFNIYEKEFVKEEGILKGYEVYSAQNDWHKPIIEQGSFRQQNQDEFIFNLQGCFRILKELNPLIYKEVFIQSLENFEDSNFVFNKDYVIRKLIPLWDNSTRDLTVFKKVRDWKFKGSKSLTRAEFIKELNNSRYRSRVKLRLEALNDVLVENRFIDLESDLAIGKHNYYKSITDLVKEWNKYVIGCKTHKSYINKGLIKDCTKNSAVHIKKPIYSAVKNVQSEINYSKIAELTNIKNRNTIKSFLNFKPDNDVKERIFNDVYFLLENCNDIEPIRQLIGGKRILDFKVEIPTNKSVEILDYIMQPADVFKPLKVIKNIDAESFNDAQRFVLDSEIMYLTLLEQIKSFSFQERKKIDEPYFRNNLIKQSLTPLKIQYKKEVKLNIAV